MSPRRTFTKVIASSRFAKPSNDPRQLIEYGCRLTLECGHTTERRGEAVPERVACQACKGKP